MAALTALNPILIVVFTLAAAVSDWRTRKLPNWLTVSALAAALLLHTILAGLPGLANALLGFAVGFGILLVLWLIGGSGGELPQLIRIVLQRLRPGGRLVMNFVTLENLATATATLSELQADWDVLQLQAARSKPILHMHRMAAENPVWLVCARQHDKEHP